MTTTENPVADNGVNVQALLDARDVLKGAPEAAQFTWRATSKWQHGVHSTTTIQNYFGLGEEQQHKTETVLDADHPEVFAATDNAITPIEYLLVGLACCLTAGVASVAQNRGIQVRSIESTVEGAHDIRGILGADSDVRNGFNNVKVTLPHRRRRVAGGHRGAGGPVAEAVRGLRRADQPDRRDRRGCLSPRLGAVPASASPRSSSGPATPAWLPVTSWAGTASTTWCSSAARWRTPGAPSGGTRCGCSRPTG